MGKYNRTTLKQRISDFINRISPFDSNPLIQKIEDNEIRDDVADSAIMRTADQKSINPTSSDITVDFSDAEEVKVITSAATQSVFSITLAGLETSQNQVCRIIISKKSGDVFTFANADYLPFELTKYQEGLSTISFFVVYATPQYKVWINERYEITDSVLSTSSHIFASANAVNRLKDYTDDRFGDVINGYQQGDTNVYNSIVNPLEVADMPTINEGDDIFTSGSFMGGNKPQLRRYADGTVRITGTVTLNQNYDFDEQGYFFIPANFRPNRVITYPLGSWKQGTGDTTLYPLNAILDENDFRIESEGNVAEDSIISLDIVYHKTN